MATTTRNQPGILSWANSVRSHMISDPARQILYDQIQTHGFQFLENYLEDILDGPKQDPIIELVKTPGRNRSVNKSKPALVSQLSNIVTISLKDDAAGKENMPPINSFHLALLQAKGKNQPPSQSPDAKVPVALGVPYHGKPSEEYPIQAAHQIAVHKIGSPTQRTYLQDEVGQGVSETDHQPFRTTEAEEDIQSRHSDNPNLLPPTAIDQNELSIIAEDDENCDPSRISINLSNEARSRTSLPSDAALIAASSHPHTREPLRAAGLAANSMDVVDSNNILDNDLATSSSSGTLYHSICIDSSEKPPNPSHLHMPTLPAEPTNLQTISHVETVFMAVVESDRGAIARQNAPGDVFGDRDLDIFTGPPSDTKPLYPSSSHLNDAVAAPVPVPRTFRAQADAGSSAPEQIPTPAPLKPNYSLFPALPAPMPLRKSIRAPHESLMGMGAATPGAAVGGKRTSWLMKTRETRALEEMGKKMSIFGSVLGGVSAPELGGRSAIGTNSWLKRKSGEMTGAAPEAEEDTRKRKVAKNDDKKPDSVMQVEDNQTLSANDPSRPPQYPPQSTASRALPKHTLQDPAPSPTDDAEDAADIEEGMLDRFKRTVEGLGARAGKSMGKSLGGAAAALAEARAAAEARLAERERTTGDEIDMDEAPPLSPVLQTTTNVEKQNLPEIDAKLSSAVRITPRAEDGVKRLSMSDLVVNGKKTPAGDSTGTVYRSFNNEVGNSSMSTTPPDSPPTKTRPPSFTTQAPVFNKPPPVFVPPPHSRNVEEAKEFSFTIPKSTVFSLPAAISLGLGARMQGIHPLTAHSTLESAANSEPDGVFDSQDRSLWQPDTQDTEYSSGFGSQHANAHAVDDDDDSWPLDEKLGSGVAWAFAQGGKEDSMTWSTLPTESQRADTGPMASKDGKDVKVDERNPGAIDLGSVDRQMYGFEVDDPELDPSSSDLEELALAPGQSTVSLVKPHNEGSLARSPSQTSMASSMSSQAPVGFLGHASKLMNSVLGTSKKGKTEVKSLQLAAAAAKKQQEEKDKKAARLKDMENRRQIANQRKAEEEKVRALEDERKAKEEAERRKREREDNTDKRPLKVAAKKEEDNTRKRKLVVELEKKPDLKKQPSKIMKPTPAMVKPVNPPKLKQPTATLGNSLAGNMFQSGSTETKVTQTFTVASSSTMMTTSKMKSKVASKPLEDDLRDKQPSDVMQAQMAARVKAQLKAAKQEPQVASESIELPDINSEYSDSEDEDRPRTFEPPTWAQSPELRLTLDLQSTVDPDPIFGPIRPLRMEELFKTRQSRFRARTSSANWTGTDRLTAEEEREYSRRMGFR